ncbi:MAG: dTDP-4-dehydrorhamnose reductase [Clostridia bacterium]|nr:dTDP-4-dehydrorhamnose reductase [Clostridia bacterium]
MKVAVTGCKGQLGADLTAEMEKRNIQAAGIDIDTVDITDYEALEAFIEAEKPDAVVHLAAYTAVDKAEQEKEKCALINVKGTENIAKICGEKGIKLLYTSTDYIFGGEGDTPFETDSSSAPCNYYGLTKYEGEQAVKKHCPQHFIVRISWVFGVHGKNFVYTMLRLAENNREIRVVNDQTGSPTFTPDISKLICDMIATDKYGVYHATNEGFCTWAEFAAEIMRRAGKDTKIIPVSTEQYPTPAKRPRNSRLSKKSLDDAGFTRLPRWEDALDRFLEEVR